MTRSLAKFLIQYHFDSSDSTSVRKNDSAERLPGWLRQWTDSDAQLRQFELELQNLEHSLSSQAESHIAFGSKPSPSAKIDLSRGYIAHRSPSLKAPFLAALAAGLACFLMAMGWLLYHASEIKPGKNGEPVIANITDAEVDTNASDVKKRKRWMVSTLETTKRLASELRSKIWQANDSMELAQQTIRKEGERAKEASLDGLRFVTKTLPIATVRMIGMNSAKKESE